VVDPGLGFSKTPEQNILLFDRLDALQALGRPVLVGPSRKRFLGAVTGQPVEARDRATATACALAWERGARLFRVHDVAAARDALTLAQAIGGP
jgi:dihydropteroate synthase